ncbi:MAG: hypothetical protein ACRCTS_08705 [Fusobacteriaceae bacterium]
MDKFQELHELFKGKLVEYNLEIYSTQKVIFVKDGRSMEKIDLEDLIEKYEDMFLDDEEDFDKVIDLNSFSGRCELFLEDLEMLCLDKKIKTDKFWDYLYSIN